MLRKHNKKNPHALNAYRPITLEETSGKVLEKIVATHIQYEAHNHSLMSRHQYGGRTRSGVMDAIIDLLGEVEQGLDRKQVITLLAVDVSGFFPSVPHSGIARRLADRGFSPATQAWVTSFLTDRKTSIRFDGYTHPPTPVQHHNTAHPTHLHRTSPHPTHHRTTTRSTH